MDTVGWIEVDMMLTGIEKILFFSYAKERNVKKCTGFHGQNLWKAPFKDLSF